MYIKQGQNDHAPQHQQSIQETSTMPDLLSTGGKPQSQTLARIQSAGSVG